MKSVKAFIICLPMFLLSALFLFHGASGSAGQMISNIVVYALYNVFFFLIILTGRTYRYRAFVFITAALLFPVGFIYHNIAERGSMLVSLSTVYECKVPFCHIVTSMILIPVAFAKTIPFPGTISGSYASIASMLIILFSAIIVIGRGWCAWGCFYGGWDECVSKLARRPRFSIVDRLWRPLPYAILVLMALSAAYTLTPVYCHWLCPFKPVTEFSPVTSLQDALVASVFFTTFIVFILVLPFLTKKRMQCSYFCPLGPTIIAFLNKFNIHVIRIDRTKCVNCGKCIKICPLNAIDEKSILEGKVKSQCAKCARCVDECPKKAIMFKIRGTALGVSADASRIIFVYSAWILAVALLGGITSKSLAIIIKLVLNI